LKIVHTRTPRMNAFGLDIDDIPPWVDLEKVRRGQRIYINHYPFFISSLMLLLLQGFVVGRFSEVLVLAGYSKTPRATFERFKQTEFAIRKWMESDLGDPLSESRSYVFLVRALHAYARQNAQTRWRQALEEGDQQIGIPLSQYDLALVLLAFGPICLYYFQYELRVTLTKQQRDDYIHLWRFIGHLLGIDYVYNSCKSTEDAERLMSEFFGSIPCYTRTVRQCCMEMFQSTRTGMSTYLGMGDQMFAATLRIMGSGRPWLDTSYMGLTTFPFCEATAQFFRVYLPRLGWPYCRYVLHLAHQSERYPAFSSQMHTYFFPNLARIQDGFWCTVHHFQTLYKRYRVLMHLSFLVCIYQLYHRRQVVFTRFTFPFFFIQ